MIALDGRAMNPGIGWATKNTLDQYFKSRKKEDAFVGLKWAPFVASL